MLFLPRRPAHAMASDAALQRNTGATLSKSHAGPGHLIHCEECGMERHMLSIKPDGDGWVLFDSGRPIEWFRTRQGAIAIGEVKAYALYHWSGIPSALTVFVDDTVSMTEARFG